MNIGAMTVDAFLARTAEKSPTPGGGSVAAMTGATAAALASMVVAYSRGRKDLAAHEHALADAAGFFERARARMLELAQQDMQAYGVLNDAMKLPKDDASRARKIEDASRAAAAPPAQIAALAIEVLERCAALVGASNKHLRSDLAIAAVLAEAAATAGRWNVVVNLPALPEAERDRERGQIDALVRKAAELRRTVESACA